MLLLHLTLARAGTTPSSSIHGRRRHGDEAGLKSGGGHLIQVSRCAMSIGWLNDQMWRGHRAGAHLAHDSNSHATGNRDTKWKAPRRLPLLLHHRGLSWLSTIRIQIDISEAALKMSRYRFAQRRGRPARQQTYPRSPDVIIASPASWVLVSQKYQLAEPATAHRPGSICARGCS